ncbi:hypothetical protein ACNR90_002172 [Candidozyma auris]
MGYETGNCTRKARIFGRFTSRRRIDGAGWELMGVVMERGFGFGEAASDLTLVGQRANPGRF